MTKTKISVGKKFGSLTVKSISGKATATVICICGKIFEAKQSHLRNSAFRSCGCKATRPRLTHGKTGSLTHNSWLSMRTRCLNKNHTAYERYGGAGITICDRWSSFELFFSDMGERPSAAHTLERIDWKKGYSPENCKWADKKEQGRNKSNNHLITYKNQTMTISMWAEKTGTNKNTILSRIRLGWTDEAAITGIKNLTKTYKGASK